MRKKQGFTVLEMILSLGIIAVTLCGLLLTYLNMFVLADVIRDNALADNAVSAKLEEIRNMDYSTLSTAAGVFNLTDYGFPSTQNSSGTVEVTTGFGGYTTTLTRVRIVASYSTRNGRIIGEDTNFNGVLDVGLGEDLNGNLRLDSPIEVVTLIAD